MKLIKLIALSMFAIFSISKVSGQANASINLLTLNGGQVSLGGFVDVQVTVGNTGPVSSIGVNKVRAQISIPIAIASAAPNAEQTGLPPGWIILSNTGAAITVCNGTDIIPVGQQRQILIKVRGDAVGGPSTISGQLSFGPGTGVCTGLGSLAGDLPADNISQSTIQVVAVTPCTLAVTASAGTIVCNGGSTTLTATATGGTGAIEYNLNGGAFQSSNTFTVGAGTYTVIARLVTNPTCTATAAPVSIANPSAVPAPTVSIVQPTCTVSNGIVTITSSTSGHTFSLDGGSYNIYPAGGYNLSPGGHTLRAQNGAGCLSAVTNFTVDPQPAIPAAPAVNVVQPTCSTATGTVTITSATTGLTFSVDGGGYGAYPAGGYSVLPGSHTLTSQNSAGCISPVTNFIVDPQPGAPAAPVVNLVQPSCTVSSGTITISSSTSGLTFSLDGGAYAAYPAGGYIVVSGAHTLTAQNTAGCISPITNITIDPQPSTPSAPIVNVVQPTCTVSTGAITVTSSTTGLLFSLDGGAYAAYPAGGYIVAPGTHTLSAQNAAGCNSTNLNFTVNAQPATPTVPEVGSITQPTCTVSTGSVILNSLPAGNWTINPGSISGNGPSTTISGLAAGTYNFTVTNAAGCTSAASANVVIDIVLGAPTAPELNVIHPTCTVATGTITITSSTSGLTFSLDGGPYGAYPVAGYIVAPGAHTISAQNASSCISPLANITVNAQPVIPAAPVANVIHPTCNIATGTITITSSTSGLIFSLDGGSYSNYPVGGYVVAAGSHTLTAQNTAGCISSILNVMVNPQPAIPSPPTVGDITQPTCAVVTGSVILNGLPAGSWTINPGSITGSTASATISGLNPGTYNFTVTNSEGCTSAASSNIVIDPVAGLPAAPSVNVVQPTCLTATGTITITSTTSGLTFSLDGGAYTAYPSGGYTVSAGAHTLTAQNAGSCISPVTNIIVDTQPATPASPSVNITQPTCTVSTGRITITSSTTGLTFSLDGGAYAVYPSAGYIVSAGTHTLTAQNASNCISPVINIIVDPQPSTPAAPIVSVVHPTCAVATGVITITSSTSGLNFSLDGGLYSSYPSGGYSVLPGSHTLVAQNTAGCISATTSITVDPQPTTPAAPVIGVVQPSCSVATGTITISSPTIGLTFSLDGGAFTAYPAGGYIVAAGVHTLSARNSSGCVSGVTTVNINIQPGSPGASLVAGVITCFGGTASITVSATGGTAPYEYSLNGGNYQSANIFITSAGLQTITVRDANLCTGIATITITQPVVITASVSAGTISCNAGTTTLTVSASGGTGIKEYRLNTGLYQLVNTFNVGAGVYTVTVRDANGCTRVLSPLSITQPAALVVSANADRIMKCGGTTEVKVVATGGTIPYQLPGTGSFIRGPGTWLFPVTDAAGCTASATVTVEAPGCMDLRIYPNPAGNTVTVDHSEAAAGSHLKVYDVTGKEVLSKIVPQAAFMSVVDISRLATGTYVMVYWNGNDKKSILFLRAKP